ERSAGKRLDLCEVGLRICLQRDVKGLQAITQRQVGDRADELFPLDEVRRDRPHLVERLRTSQRRLQLLMKRGVLGERNAVPIVHALRGPQHDEAKQVEHAGSLLRESTPVLPDITRSQRFWNTKTARPMRIVRDSE